MAPRDTPKATPKVQRTIVKTAGTKSRTPVSIIKKTMSAQKTDKLKTSIKGKLCV